MKRGPHSCQPSSWVIVRSRRVGEKHGHYHKMRCSVRTVHSVTEHAQRGQAGRKGLSSLACPGGDCCFRSLLLGSPHHTGLCGQLPWLAFYKDRNSWKFCVCVCCCCFCFEKSSPVDHCFGSSGCLLVPGPSSASPGHTLGYLTGGLR